MNDATRKLAEKLAGSLFDMCVQEPELLRGWRAGFDRELLALLRLAGVLFLERWMTWENRRLVKQAKVDGYVVERSPKIKVLTVMGWVTVVSSYIRRSGDQTGLRPLNTHFGLAGNQSTNAVQRAMTDFGMERSFGDAAAAFEEHYGVAVGATTVQNITERHAHRIQRELDEWYAQAPEPAREHRADRMILGMDGCCLRVTERVTAGRLGRSDLPADRPVRVDRWVDTRLAKARREGDATGVFVCQHASFEDVLQALEGAARRRGRTAETELVFLGDGGNGLMEAAIKRFPQAHFVLDRLHLRQHLYEVVRHIGTVEHAVEHLVDVFDTVIGRGDAWWVILELRALVPARKRAKAVESCPITNLIGYLERFANCIRYDDFERRGWPTGSGEIESGHRQVPQARLKLPGAAWTVANLNAMAATRAARESGLWKQFWPKAA